MNDRSVSAVDGYMARVTDQIARFCVGKGGNHSAVASLRNIGTAERISEMRIYTLRKTGAVRSVGQAGAAVHIRVPKELGCIGNNVLSGNTG